MGQLSTLQAAKQTGPWAELGLVGPENPHLDTWDIGFSRTSAPPLHARLVYAPRACAATPTPLTVQKPSAADHALAEAYPLPASLRSLTHQSKSSTRPPRARGGGAERSARPRTRRSRHWRWPTTAPDRARDLLGAAATRKDAVGSGPSSLAAAASDLRFPGATPPATRRRNASAWRPSLGSRRG